MIDSQEAIRVTVTLSTKPVSASLCSWSVFGDTTSREGGGVIPTTELHLQHKAAGFISGCQWDWSECGCCFTWIRTGVCGPCEPDGLCDLCRCSSEPHTTLCGSRGVMSCEETLSTVTLSTCRLTAHSSSLQRCVWERCPGPGSTHVASSSICMAGAKGFCSCTFRSWDRPRKQGSPIKHT